MKSINLTILAGLIYNIAILYLFGYAVFILERSGWWFLLAILLLAQVKGEKSNVDKK